jgi:LCP family protein required for cell wall assembly
MGTYADPRVAQRRVGRYAPSVPPPPKVKAPTPKVKRRDPIWAKVCLIVGALVMVGSGTLVIVPRMLVNAATKGITKDLGIPEELRGANIDGAINILLLGMDERAGNSTDPIRTDSMIIAHISADHKQAYMISLPRDTEVAIPDFPESNFKGWRTKINAAFAFGNLKNGKPDTSDEGRNRGVKLTLQTINNLVPGGLKFNAVAVINFEGFRDVMDVIGGVYMCVDERTTSVHFDKAGKYHSMIENVSQRKVYEKGCYQMAGWEALDFARQRYGVTGGDYGRQKHQQQLLSAIFKKMTSSGVLTNPSKLLDLQKVAGNLLTVDMGKTEVADWLVTLKGLTPNSITMIKTNGGVPNTNAAGNEVLTPDSMNLLKAVHDDTVYDFAAKHPTWLASAT